jgi:hypothetical protein
MKGGLGTCSIAPSCTLYMYTGALYLHMSGSGNGRSKGHPYCISYIVQLQVISLHCIMLRPEQRLQVWGGPDLRRYWSLSDICHCKVPHVALP